MLPLEEEVKEAVFGIDKDSTAGPMDIRRCFIRAAKI